MMTDIRDLSWTFHADIMAKGLSALEDALRDTSLTQYHREEVPLALEETRAALAAIKAHISAIEQTTQEQKRFKQSA
jgi:hypothetical protein